ncbi:NYN domain-containing protein [Cellulomonas sp. HZM]|uniref:NYN domain-containing protein n=1 Tax=Cellulomonas sp. HZM TaxID=1454010 RepID=UPI000493865A|nr:NYN domain-containing protein [Cellulomonas sp. HZM]
MADPSDAKVAVYVDFDNIVISRYDQVFGRGSWGKDRARVHGKGDTDEVGRKLAQAAVDVDAILDYASSFGTFAVTRAYADWSSPANAAYQRQLVDRAVDLTQLFSVTAGMKNGADIRLSVDVVEDLFRLDDVTHVVIVAGDSDYIALAQRARRLGRYVVGIGVAGATSRALMAACDEFADYDDVLEQHGPDDVADDEDDVPVVAPAKTSGRGRAADGKAQEKLDDAPAGTTPTRGENAAPADEGTPAKRSRKEQAKQEPAPVVASGPSKGAQRAATQLLMRAMRLVHAKHPDDPWVSYGEVKNQMLRMDPAFTEKPLGFASFTDFVAARHSQVEIGKAQANGQARIRLRPGN